LQRNLAAISRDTEQIDAPLHEIGLVCAKASWPGLCYMSVVKRNGHGAGVHRSKFYHLLNPIAPINHALKAKVDVFGSLLIIVLLLAGVSLFRFVLSWVH
jgi:hypothetical protein